MKFENHIEYLKKVAETSDVSRKHSAALIVNNKLICVGKNKHIGLYRTCQPSVFKFTIHAEIDAIIKCQLIRGADILIIRIGKAYDLRNSRPCNACIDKMKQKGVRKVYYSDENGDIKCEFVENMEKLHESSGNAFRKRQL